MKVHARRLREVWCRATNHFVLERLNKEPRNAAVQRVIRIIELLIRADQLRIEIYKAEFLEDCYESCEKHLYTSKRKKLRTGYTFRDPAINQMNRQYEGCLIELEKRLRQYRWRPAIVDFNYLHLDQIFVFGVRGRDKFWEHEAIRIILFDAKTGFQLRPSKLSRIRRCKDCAQWFAAKTDHQHFCGEACRKHYASQSPEFREKRREYMRERYRPMQKEAEQRARKQARPIVKGRK